MQSVKNGKQIFGLLKTLGIGGDVIEARKNLYSNVKDPEKMKAIDRGVEGQREHFDNVGLFLFRCEIVLMEFLARTPHRLRLRQRGDPAACLEVLAKVPRRCEATACVDMPEQ